MTERTPAADLLRGDRIVVCDGAMGTMLYAADIGLTQSLCELNVGRPRLVLDIHRAYLAAGAQLVQTNTFDGNRLRLARSGWQHRVSEFNIAGARLAREAVAASGSPALVAGSVGPAMSAALVPRFSKGERAAALGEQIAALADWVDLIVLETFGDIESLAQAVAVAHGECDLPVIAQLTFGDDGRTLRGEEPAEVAAAIGVLDVTALGANCTVGPAVLQPVVAMLAAASCVPIAVQPNAGTPRRRGKQVHYADNVDYFADAARQFVANGAGIVGGCCGTTPAHIRAVANAVAGLAPVARRAPAATRAARRPTAVPAPEPVAQPWPATEAFTVLVGTRAPRDSDVTRFLERAQSSVAAGVTDLAIIDPDPAAAQVSPVAAAVLLQERLGARVVVQVDTVHRSLAGLQADLLGAHALGLHVVVCRTGGLRIAGDYPDSAWTSDVDSLRLIGALTGLNEGIDWRGAPMNSRTRFTIGARASVAATDRQRELDRIADKAQAGAHFLLMDAGYDIAETRGFLAALRARGVDLPVIAALAPFDDAITVARLTHEMPEVSTSMSAAELDPVQGALSIVAALRGLVAGVLLHAPSTPDPRMAALLVELGSGRGAS